MKGVSWRINVAANVLKLSIPCACERRMVEMVVEDLGGLDVAVNNAGLNRNHAAEECSEDDWDATFGLNTKAVFLCCQAEGRHMLAKGAPPALRAPASGCDRVASAITDAY